MSERFPRHRLQRKPLVSDPGMHHGTRVTHVPWCMSGSQTRSGGENFPGIPGAIATRNFTYLARGPLISICANESMRQLDIDHERNHTLDISRNKNGQFRDKIFFVVHYTIPSSLQQSLCFAGEIYFSINALGFDCTTNELKPQPMELHDNVLGMFCVAII